MSKRKNFHTRQLQLARTNKVRLEYVSVWVAARVLYISRGRVLHYFASGALKGFRVGLAKTAAIKIARSSLIEFGAKLQGRTITPDEIDRWLVE